MNIRPPLRRRSYSSLMELKPLLDEINDEVEQPDYIQHDPVQFMHMFTDKKDIELAGFFAATMAWGRRDIVVAKVDDLLKRMNYRPHEFVMSYEQKDYFALKGFKHRTFKPIDIHGLILALQNIYHEYSDFESFWKRCRDIGFEQKRPFLAVFHERFFSMSSDLASRTRKHVSDPEKGSTCKRLYMYLRWTIRKNSPVDVGIWNFMEPSELLIPFDVHVARQARKYGLISRRSDDWKTVNQLTETLSLMNPDDPARYDYALFGIGALDYSLPVRFILNKV
ncbi:TIGR02757 family protein [Rhodohalobacter sp.]|uniref:TIGR02757 family protein n=1 Tax=Rhodohalobacter sp. TaxID=1974210 RepID=UPI002ACEB831|nr:TIGR02757 family protein [Rhodohalobacter sp.]MDZ7756689.1 TIGR02757 family protein [Rhodohalobacter sp.]